MARLVHILVLLHVLTTPDSSSIKRCLDTAPRVVNKGRRIELPNSGLFLYQLDSSVTWCQAYHLCKQAGHDLASIKAQSIQDRLERDIRVANIRGLIWLGARRKDFGKNWTWINETLTDCRLSLSERGYPSAVVLPTTNNVTKTYASNRLDNWFCVANRKIIEQNGTNVTWFDAQNSCQTIGGRLATSDDLKSTNKQNYSYWIGLYRNPWIWIAATYEPVLYSSWADNWHQHDDCMVINPNKNSSWTSVPCTQTTPYVLCEGKRATFHVVASLLSALLFVVLTVLIILLSVLYAKKKKHGQACDIGIFSRISKLNQKNSNKTESCLEMEMHACIMVKKANKMSTESKAQREYETKHYTTDNYTDFFNEDDDQETLSVVENTLYN